MKRPATDITMWPQEERQGGGQGQGNRRRRKSSRVNNTAIVLLALVVVTITTLQSVSASQDHQRHHKHHNHNHNHHNHNNRAGTRALKTQVRHESASSRRRGGLPAYYWSRSHRNWSQYSQRPSHIGPLPHINDVMSEWSNWSNWGRCSRSCGGGVRSRTRSCVTSYPRVMPGSGVRTSHDRCAGESAEYGVCGAATCPPGQVSALSFRAAQCRRYNNRSVFGRIVNNWIPYTQGGINPCALVCEGEGEGIVYTFGKVTDGTHCKTTEEEGAREGLCVNGRCLRVSCDGRLGGGALEDMCRVCGGHNETCTRHSGVFHTDRPAADQPPKAAALTSSSSSSSSTAGLLRSGSQDQQQQQQTPQSLGYHEVALIPRGATNVKATDHSANFLALRAGNKYILNGDWLIDWPGDVDAGGTTFSYARSQDESETLSALGPTTEDLTLMVLLREHNPGIHYEYWTPNSLPGNPPFIIPLQAKSSSSTDITTSSPSNGLSPVFNSSSFSSSSSNARRTGTTPPPAVITNIDVVRPQHHIPEIEDPSEFQPTRKEEVVGEEEEEEEEEEEKHTEVTTESNRLPQPPEPTNRGPPPLQPSTGYSQHHQYPSRTNTSIERHRPSTSFISSSSSGSSPIIIISPGGSPRQDPREPDYRPVKGERKDKDKERQDRKERRRKKKKKKKKTSKDKGDGAKKSHCGPCERVKRAKENFCTSDFVSRVEVESSDIVGSEVRHVVLIHQSYKNTVPLLHKEFLWVSNSCGCPRLRTGRTYLLMGRTDTSRGREVRLVVGKGSYVRRYSPRAFAKVMRLRRNEMRYCRPWRRNLRFVQPPPPPLLPPPPPPPSALPAAPNSTENLLPTT